MRAFRTETGLRLLLLSLALTILATTLPQFLGASLAVMPVGPSSLLLHTVLLPGVTDALIVTCATCGIIGIAIIESNRGRLPKGAPRRWDPARLVAVLAFSAGGIILVSGIVLALVYLPDHWILTAIRVASFAAIALGVGLYLFWTGQRMDAARRLSQIALALGIVSAGLASAISVALRVGVSFEDPVEGMALTLSVSVTGILSLVGWIVVYAGILARFRFSRGPSPIPGGA